MNDLKKFGKKLFTMSVVSMTIAWSVGLSALVPAGVVAATCPELEAGDLFKVKGNAAVYLLNSNMERMYFPNSEVYNTWYKDFSGITTIEPACVDAYPSCGGVNFRPGARLVKSAVSPSVFAVGPDNMKHKIADEKVAAALYGSAWSKLVRVIPDVFDSNYKVGAELKEAKLHDGQLVMKSGDTTVYYVWMGMLKKVDGTLPSQTSGDVRTVSVETLASVSMDTATVTGATVTTNPAQKGTATSPTTPTSAGKLKVSIAANTPSGTYAVKSAARVPFTNVVFENTSGDTVTIDSFKVVRGGAPAVNADFTTVNVVDEMGNLLNDAGKSLNSENMVTFTEDIVLTAGAKKTYTLVGDMAGSGLTGGNVPTLGLYSVDTKATVEGVLPMYGNAVVTNANVTLGTVTLAEGSTIGTVTKQVGTKDVNLASLKITVATEDFQIGRVVFYNSGTAADGDIEKFVLKYNGNIVAQGAMKNKYLTFDLSACTADCKLEKGNDKTFNVYADLIAGSARTSNLDIQRTVHVLAKDLKNNYYVTPTNNASAMTNTVTVSQGKLDVSKTNNVPTGNVPRNATNQSLGTWNFKVTGEPVDVRTIVFRLTTTGTIVPTGLDSITLYNAAGKALIGGVDGAGSASPGYATSTDSFTLPVGDNILTLKAKVDSTAVANDTIAVAIDLTNTSNFDARGVNSGETITLGTYATPQSAVSANTMTVKGSALRVTTLSTPPATTYAAGTNDVVFAKVLFDTSDSSEDAKVTQFIITNTTAGGAKGINIQSVRLFVDLDGDSYDGKGSAVALTETQSGAQSTANTAEDLTFNLSGTDQFLVKAGKKVEVWVKGNIAGGAAAGTHTFSVDTANDIAATGATTGGTITEVIDSAAGQAMTVGAAGGTVEVSLDPSNQTAKQYAAGTKGVTLATFRFYATSSEDVELDKINLTQLVTATASSSFKDYDMVYLYNAAGDMVGSASPTSTSVFIDLADKAFVAKSSDTSGTLLVIKADLSSIGPSQNVTTGGHSLGYKILAASAVGAKGSLTGSTSVVYLGSSVPTGQTHVMFKAIPTVQVCTGTVDDASNCKQVNGVLANGSNDLIRFRVKANTSDVGLYKFTFDITTTTASVTSVELFDTTESNEISLYSNTALASTPYVEALFDTDSSGVTSGGEERTVSAGTSRYFALRGTLTAVATGASVSTRLGGDAASSAGTVSATLMDSAVTADSTALHDDFIWSDRSAGAHATTTLDWTNGYLVNGLNSASSTPIVVAK